MKSQRSNVDGSDTRKLKALEKPLIKNSSTGGDIRVHLVYPNSYWVAMSNLGFQAVFGLLAKERGVIVERAFLPENPKEGDQLRTFETSRLLGDCDLLAFSLSFETDYLNFVSMLNRSGLLATSAEERDSLRGPSFWGAPFILAGGTSVTLNPEPVADLLDLAFLGEAEEFIPELISSVRQARDQGDTRVDALRRISQCEGIYVPRFTQIDYNAEGPVTNIQRAPTVARAQRRFVKDLSSFPTYSNILTPETEFKSMFLTETGRGCEMGCRFCVAGYIYRPVRKRSEESLAETVKIGLQHSKAIGFVGASVSSHKGIANLAKSVADQGGRASLSSLMSQKVSKELAISISESEYRTVALAPEAGNERLRRAAGKRVNDQQVVSAAEELARSGIRGFKLYFIVGLPTETEDDVDSIGRLAIQIRDTVTKAARTAHADAPENFKQPWVVLSVNPFIPKANTPFQWEPMLDRKVLEKKIERIRKAVARESNVELHFESPKESYLQALLSRGDRRVAQYLVLAEREKQDWKWLLKQAEKGMLPNVPALGFYASRRIPFGEILPWDSVDSRIEKKLLQREAERAHGLELGPLVELEEAKDLALPPTEEMISTALFG